jgi:predicted Zn-dependent protease with MMP-like domain
MKLTRPEFESLVRRAIDRIPSEFHLHLKEVSIVVKDYPSDKLMQEMECPPDEPLLGLYEGTPLTERSVTDPVRLPDQIVLFQIPLEEMCQTVGELEEEVEITVVHELAHYMGLDDDRLEELGYG